MSVEVKAQLLAAIRKEPLGVRELVGRLRMRPETVISLIHEMEQEGLVESSDERIQRKGRPKRMLKPTALGEEYVEAFRRLTTKTLRASRNDLAKAKREAEYVNRLIARGKNPYQIFVELNALVRAGRNAA